MNMLLNSTSTAALEVPKKVRKIKDFPNSYIFTVEVSVVGSATLEHAMRNGAPNTQNDTFEQIKAMHQQFPPAFSGYARKQVTLFSFGEFVHQRRVEELALDVKKSNKVTDMGIRTMLAIGDDHRTLCKEKGFSRLRLVCLTLKFRHLDLWHIPTLRQEDRSDCVTNAVVLEPYDFGWSAEHVFGFERNA